MRRQISASGKIKWLIPIKW